MSSAKLLLLAAVLFPAAMTIDRFLPLTIADGTVFLTDFLVGIAVINSYSAWALGRFRARKHAAMGVLLLLTSFQLVSVWYAGVSSLPLLRMGVHYATFVLILVGSGGGLSWKTVEVTCYWGLSYVPFTVILEAVLYALGFPIGATMFGNFENSIRFVGVAGDPAQASMISLLLTSFALYRIGGPAPRKRVSDPIMLLISVAAILLTATRASVVCLIAVYVFFLLDRRKGRIELSFVGLSIGVALVASVLASAFQGDVLAVSRFSDDSGEGILYQRLTPMAQSFDVGVSAPLFGVGFGNEGLVVSDSVGGVDSVGYVGSFNQYLHAFVESGIVGLVFTVWFLAIVLICARRCASRQESNALAMGAYVWFIALIVVYQTETWWTPGSRISMIFFALSATVIRLARKAPYESDHGRGLAA